MYWRVRERLLDRGIIERGRGRGGSVRLVVLDEQEEDEPDSSPVIPEERLLYEPMKNVIANEWARDKGIKTCYTWITASQGRRETGGRWSRPDITMVARRKYPYYPLVVYDVITFEIKQVNNFDLTAIYEALAHRRLGNHAYLIVHVPSCMRETINDILEIVSLEARRHGIGFIVAEDPRDFETWEEVVESERRDGDPKAICDFLKIQAHADPVTADQIQDVFS